MPSRSFAWLAAIGFAVAFALVVPVTIRTMSGKHTIASRVAEFERARRALRDTFARASVPFPPQRVTLVAIKRDKQLHVYAPDAEGRERRVATYPILAASGTLGPKRREGDRQVPEGVYPIESLNPNSRFHVALRVGYPNAMDRAEAEPGTDLGGDIMIHGGTASIGCLAMGDETAEELFVLVAQTGVVNATIVLAPVDLRVDELPDKLDTDALRDRYTEVHARLAELP